MRNPAQKSIEEKGTTMKKIDYTKAIASGILSFEEACAIQGATMTQAIQEGILDFERACQLQGISVEVSQAAITKAPEKPAPKKAAPKKAAPKPKSAKKQPPKPEVKTFSNGMKYHTPKNHALTEYQVKRLDDAVLKLWEAGYTKAEWRVEGKWAWIYTFSGEKGTGYTPAFKAAVKKAFKGTKWEYSQSRGAVVYKDFLK